MPLLGLRRSIRRRPAAGLTLIEMMATVAVVGILAGIAIPSYLHAVNRSRLRAALDVLRTIAAGEKVFYIKNGLYLHVPHDAADTEWKKILMDLPNPNPTELIYGGLCVASAGPCDRGFTAIAYTSNAQVLRLDQDGNVDCVPLTSGTPVGVYTAADCP